MAYQFIITRHKLTPEEQEMARFIQGVNKVSGMVKQPPDPLRVGALQSFEQRLVTDVLKRVGLDKSGTMAVLSGTDAVITCHVGNIIGGS